MGLVLILLVVWLIQPTGLDFKVYRDGGYTLFHDQAGLYAHYGLRTRLRPVCRSPTRPCRHPVCAHGVVPL